VRAHRPLHVAVLILVAASAAPSAGCRSEATSTDAASDGGPAASSPSGAATAPPAPAAPVAPVAGRVAFGDAHACALTPEGKVLCWGENAKFQLGRTSDGLRLPHPPALVDGLEGVVEITASENTTCARTKDGAVGCWGDMPLGIPESAKPVTTPGLTGTRGVALGASHACAIGAGGEVVCWGENAAGECGQPPSKLLAAPTPVPGIAAAKRIAAGKKHTCAIVEDGRVVCWGANSFGQLGDGTTEARNGLVSAKGVARAVAIAAFGENTCAADADGAVHCWGADNTNQLGGSGTDVGSGPVAVRGVQAVELAVGKGHACALQRDGTAVCWGARASGERGAGSPAMDLLAEDMPRPAVLGLAGATSIGGGPGVTCALRGAEIFCWGDNTSGLLGSGAARQVRTPVDVALPGAAIDVVAGRTGTCALLRDRTVACWGAGFGSWQWDDKARQRTSFAKPELVAGLSNVASIVSSEKYLCARDGEAEPSCFVLGLPLEPTFGKYNPDWKPSRIEHLGGLASIDRGNVIEGWSYAVFDDGRVAAVHFDRRFDGPRGNALYADVRPVSGFPPATSVSGTMFGATGLFCVLARSGRVACVHLENKTTDKTLPAAVTPTFVPGVDDAIDAEVWFSKLTVVTKGGRVLSSRTPIDSAAFALTEVADLEPVIDVARDTTFGLHECAVARSGKVLCWSPANDLHGLHCTGADRQPKPTACPGIDDATKIVAGYQHACALRKSGRVSCWGNDEKGAVGSASPPWSPVPVAVAVGARAR